ncbi:MAG: hypothetical protein PVI41_03820 [Roseobacter sp.]|jgi:hypothetical protein
MNNIPQDATHWDSGDWIEWYRSVTGMDERPCSVATQEDPLARLTALHVSLLRAAKAYFQLTGHHLPVYQQIAETYAAIHCDIPFEGPDRNCAETGVEIVHLPPHGPSNMVDVDLALPFDSLIVVRIKDNFACEARMIRRNALPDSHEGPYPLSWQGLPNEI